MKLKLVVASMSVLGLVSCPVFAATTTKHKSHHKYHKVVSHHEDEAVYKKEVVPVHAAPVAVCAIPESAILMDEMTQNVGRAIPNPCNPGWFNRIAVSGGINVDIGKWGNRNANYMGENYQRLSLNDVYLNILANVNDWAKAFASISYNTATVNDVAASTATNHVSEFDAAYSNNVQIGSTAQTLQLEQGFITIGNFDQSPIFFQFGKMFQDFGRYEIHPITEPLTQVMSKTLATSAKIGFVASGFTGSAYVFDDPLPRNGQSQKSTNYGAALGYEQPQVCDSVGWDIGVAYLWNIIGANDIAYQVNQFNLNNTTLGGAFDGGREGYQSRASGLAAYADLTGGPFYVGLRYTTALQRFNVIDLPKHGTADIDAATGAPVDGATGAKPWTAGIQAGFGFCAFCNRDQTVYAGYQRSNQAAGLLIPKYRWLLGYNIDVWKSTNFGVEWDNDHGYSTGSGGNGKTTNLVSLRAAIKFN